MKRAFSLFSVFFFLHASPVSSDTLKKDCAQILAEQGIEDVFSTQAHFRKALEIVLHTRLAEGNLPSLTETIGQTQKAGDAAFETTSRKLAVDTTIPGDVDWEDAGDETEDVFTFEFEGRTYFFRPIRGGYNTGTQARKTMAATTLNQAMNLKTVPIARWAKVNDELGSLSEEAPGIPFTSIPKFKSILTQLAEGYPEILADIVAFEFLVGNKDAARRNVMIDISQVIVQVFDHDNAFLAGLVPVRGENAEEAQEILFGAVLPETYTKNFVASLKALTPKKLKTLLAPYLSTVEIEGIIFRREIILEDLKIRKPKLL